MAGDARERRRRERRYLRRRTDRAATKCSQAQDVVVSRPLDLRISWPRSLPLAMRPPSSSGTRKRELSRRPWRWHRKPWLWAANGAGVDGGRAEVQEGRRRCRMADHPWQRRQVVRRAGSRAFATFRVHSLTGGRPARTPIGRSISRLGQIRQLTG
jgi:hypothetical protein